MSTKKQKSPENAIQLRNAHRERLKQGKQKWNKWRQAEPEVTPYLFDSDLRGFDFSGYDLSDADLTDCDLRECKFVKAKLDKADLSFSKLAGADFSKSTLIEVSMGECDLQGANFKQAMILFGLFGESNFDGANFAGALAKDAVFDQAYMRKANFDKATFGGSSLRGANLSLASLREASFAEVDLSEALIEKANLDGAWLPGSNFRDARLFKSSFIGANLENADLRNCDLRGAVLQKANLCHADMTGARLDDADLSESQIYGVAAWNVQLSKKTKQTNLLISAENEPALTVDDIEIAQFIHLISNNQKIRNLLETITSKAVLILGRFTPERKQTIDALKAALRDKNYVPIVFDFEKAASRDITETIKVLAGMCLFIIADISQPKSSPLELQATVPDYMTPFVPIIQAGEKPFAMFKDLANKYDWVLDPLEYASLEILLKSLNRGIIRRALDKHAELMEKHAQELRTVSAADFADPE
ncbi:MAG: pentapeptide repeat-containing protein [Deferribacteres bacterium]|nr:pentapeptide repeat-containing protein [candidate division KSB1 bacterium]MCB9509678.1 pentapeptide repeat-containing protein [Deferribacteres bacterium]